MKYRFILFLLFLLTASSLLTGCTMVAPTKAINQMEPQAQANTPIEPVASQVPGPTTLPRQSKKAYLTFDDGPNSHFTGPILDILKRYDVKATFVVVGRNIERNPEVFKRILDEGHGVVNHTYSHDYNNIYASPASFLADLERCNRCITPAVGDKSRFSAPQAGRQN